jgi:putative component of membrane protein insertase Oxa1/YidC/SpoIIIJ protein YidD
MRSGVRYILCLVLIIAAQVATAQRNEFSRYTDLFDSRRSPGLQPSVKHGVGKAVLMFYKRRISSQDGSRCQFAPTCSEYAVQSAQRRGLVIGSLAAFDRLARCHGFSRRHYAHSSDERLIDPVE